MKRKKNENISKFLHNGTVLLFLKQNTTRCVCEHECLITVTLTLVLKKAFYLKEYIM